MSDQVNPIRHVVVSVHESELTQQLMQFLRKVFAEHLTVEAEKTFVIGYSGGSMPKALIPVLEQAIEPQHRSKVRLFPVDERLVPLEDPDNNTNIYLKSLASLFNEEQFAILPKPEDGQASADFLSDKLNEWSEGSLTSDGWPKINVLFLGMGPDGHTCSLFPGHPILKETKKWTAFIEDSPKPPPRRVTVTMPLVNAAQNVAFIVSGEEKAGILKEIIVDNSTKYPAGQVQLAVGHTVHFFLDSSAASKLGECEGIMSVKFTGHL